MVSVGDAVIGIVLSFVQVLLSLVFALAAVYIGIKMFDRFTKDVDEMEELKRGNVAIGVLLAAVIISISTVISGGIGKLTSSFFTAGLTLSARLTGFIGGLITLLVTLALALVVIRLAIWVFDRMTKGIDEQAELRRGNVAIALVLGGILIGLAAVVQAGTTTLSDAFAQLGNALFP